jgi:general secretion pathway protein K
VRVIDEAGKLGLNVVDGTLLRAIFTNLDIPETEAETIADSIVDWRDDDDFHQPNGAESEYYEGLDRPYRAKNAAFDSVEELLLVRGVTRDIFYGHDDVPGLVDLFSVFNKNKKLNPRSISPAVMQALGGLDRDAADDFASKRRGSGSTAALEELRTLLTSSGSGPLGDQAVPVRMTIEARVHDLSGQVVLAHIGAVLNLSSSGDGLRLYRWYDSIFDDSDQSRGAPVADANS